MTTLNRNNSNWSFEERRKINENWDILETMANSTANGNNGLKSEVDQLKITTGQNTTRSNAALQTANQAKAEASSVTDLANRALNNAAQAENISNNAVEIASDSIGIAESVRTQFDQIVAESGDSNPEIVQARNGQTTLNARLTEEYDNTQRDLNYVKQNVNVVSFGAVGDFNEFTESGTDNLSAIQSAANFARDNNMDIYFPPGNYLVNGELDIYNSLVGEGVLYFNHQVARARINIRPTKPAIEISPGTLTGFTEGSTLISGFASDFTDATLIIESSETLIKRYLPPNNAPYTKTEVALITDNQGRIFPSLDYGFNTSLITSVRVLPKEKKLFFSVDVRGFGSAVKPNYLIATFRGNICFNKIDISSKNSVPITNIISVNEGTLIEFNNVKISGARLDADGYGVALYKSAFITFNECSITDCRHAVSGRHAKAVTIIGGSYSENIDCHWGSGYLIKDAKILRRILFAGRDMIVTGCTFYSTDQCLVLRYDTPEIKGKLEFTNNKIESQSTGQITLVNYAMQTYNAFDFENILGTPSTINISDNEINVASSRNVRLLNTTNTNDALHRQANFLNVNIQNNVLVNENNISIVMVYTPNQIQNTLDSKLTIKNQKMNGGKTTPLVNLTIRGTDARTATWKYIIDVDNCENVSLYVDHNTFRRLSVNNSSVVFIARIFADVTPNGDVYGVFLNNCILRNSTITMDQIDWNLSNCFIEGEFIVQPNTLAMLRRSVGTYLKPGTTGSGGTASIDYFNYLKGRTV